MTWSINALKTPSGLLKVGHVVFGVLCFVLASVYETGPYVTVIISGEGQETQTITFPRNITMCNEYFAFLLIVFSCLITSFLLLVAYMNEECAESFKKSTVEILFHLFAFLLYLSSTITVIVYLTRMSKEEIEGNNVTAHAFAVIFGLVNSFLYALNAFLGFRTVRQTR